MREYFLVFIIKNMNKWNSLLHGWAANLNMKKLSSFAKLVLQLDKNCSSSLKQNLKAKKLSDKNIFC